MKRLVYTAASLLLASFCFSAQAQDLAAGQAVFQAKCVTCHGANGSNPTNPEYPILAGQHADYIAQALKAYRRGATAGSNPAANNRKNAIMAAFATQLSDADIQNVAAWLAQQPGPLSIKH